MLCMYFDTYILQYQIKQYFYKSMHIRHLITIVAYFAIDCSFLDHYSPAASLAASLFRSIRSTWSKQSFFIPFYTKWLHQYSLKITYFNHHIFWEIGTKIIILPMQSFLFFCHDNKERLKLKVPYVELTAFIIHINRSCPKLEKGQVKKFHSALFNFLGRASLVNKRVTTDSGHHEHTTTPPTETFSASLWPTGANDRCRWAL